MNTELIPKAGQQNRSGTIPTTKVIFRPISLNQLLPTVQHQHSYKCNDLNHPDKTYNRQVHPYSVAGHSQDILLTRFLAPFTFPRVFRGVDGTQLLGLLSLSFSFHWEKKKVKEKKGKKKEKGKKQRKSTTHTCSPIHTPTPKQRKKKEKGKLYEVPIWNEMDF